MFFFSLVYIQYPALETGSIDSNLTVTARVAVWGGIVQGAVPCAEGGEGVEEGHLLPIQVNQGGGEKGVLLLPCSEAPVGQAGKTS